MDAELGSIIKEVAGVLAIALTTWVAHKKSMDARYRQLKRRIDGCSYCSKDRASQPPHAVAPTSQPPPPLNFGGNP